MAHITYCRRRRQSSRRAGEEASQKRLVKKQEFCMFLRMRVIEHGKGSALKKPRPRRGLRSKPPAVVITAERKLEIKKREVENPFRAFLGIAKGKFPEFKNTDEYIEAIRGR